MANYAYRTVIDAAALSHALVDATTVFAELGITAPTDAQTTQMETVILQVSALIDRFLDRTLAEQDVTDFFREPSGDVLRLSHYPVAQILEVTESGTALTSDYWELDALTGQLWRLGSSDRYVWSGSGNTQISYIGGYIMPDDVPADIQRAAIDQIKANFMGGSRDPALRSFSVPEVFQASYSVGGGDTGSGQLLTQVERALAPYRRVQV